MENKDKILQVLSENKDGLKAGEIAEKTGIDKKEVDKIIKKMKDDNFIHSPKRCYYSIK